MGVIYAILVVEPSVLKEQFIVFLSHLQNFHCLATMGIIIVLSWHLFLSIHVEIVVIAVVVSSVVLLLVIIIAIIVLIMICSVSSCMKLSCHNLPEHSRRNKDISTFYACPMCTSSCTMNVYAICKWLCDGGDPEITHYILVVLSWCTDI